MDGWVEMTGCALAWKKGNRTEIVSCGGGGKGRREEIEDDAGKELGKGGREKSGVIVYHLKLYFHLYLASWTTGTLILFLPSHLSTPTHLFSSSTLSSTPLSLHYSSITEGLLGVSRLVSSPPNSPQDPHQWEEEAPAGIPHWISRIGRTTHSLHTLRRYLPNVHPICPISGSWYSIHHYKYFPALTVLIWIPHSGTDRKWIPCIIYKVHIIHPLYSSMIFIYGVHFLPATDGHRAVLVKEDSYKVQF